MIQEETRSLEPVKQAMNRREDEEIEDVKEARIADEPVRRCHRCKAVSGPVPVGRVRFDKDYGRWLCDKYWSILLIPAGSRKQWQPPVAWEDR